MIEREREIPEIIESKYIDLDQEDIYIYTILLF